MPRNKKNNKNNKARRQSTNVVSLGPVMSEKNIMIPHRFCFQSATNNQTQITVGNLISAFGCMATGANTVNVMCKAVRLKRIRIWTSPVTLGIALTNGVEWLSSDVTVMTQEVRDSSNTPERPAYVDVKPLQTTQAWYWRTVSNVGGGANTGLFNIVAPTGSLIEVTMTGILSDVAFANYGIATTAAATVSEIYYGGLDGIGTGTGNYVPIGLQTIV